MIKKNSFTLIFVLLQLSLYAQSDSLKVKRFHISAQILTGLNLTGHYNELSVAYMASIGVSYELERNFSLESEFRIGKMSYINELNDRKASFKTNINYLNIRIPLICAYKFKNRNDQDNWSIRMGFGYSELTSINSTFKTINTSSNLVIIGYPTYPLFGKALYGVVGVTRNFAPFKKKTTNYFVSIEGNLDLIVKNKLIITNYSYEPSDVFYKETDFNPHSKMLFISTGINF